MESSFTTNGGIDIAILNDCERRENRVNSATMKGAYLL
jgi:hypothetical protein